MVKNRNSGHRDAPHRLLLGEPRGGALLKVLVLLVLGAVLTGVIYIYVVDDSPLRSVVARLTGSGTDVAGKFNLAENQVFWYTVGPEDVALVQRFGAYTRTTGPGLHFKLPFSIETVIRVRAKAIRRIEELPAGDDGPGVVDALLARR